MSKDRSAAVPPSNSMARRQLLATQFEFTDREDLCATLIGLADSFVGKTAIFAGHYMVVYRHKENRLVPLLKSVVDSDPAASNLEREYTALIGDFPEASFELALKLVASCPSAERRIVLLVNDHYFKVIQPGVPSGMALARLKYNYYRSNSVPKALETILLRYPNIGPVFERNDAQRSTENTLPSRTVFFSENVLRNRFERLRKPWILTQPGFRWSGGIYGGMRLVYSSPRSARQVCLLDNRDGCGCSGAMIELLLQLWESGTTNLVLFIPDECRGPVAEAIEATLQALVPFQTVVAVWSEGTGSNGEAVFKNATRYDLG